MSNTLNRQCRMGLRLTVRYHICRLLLFLWSHTPRQKLRCDCSTMHLFSYTAAGFIPRAPKFIPPQTDEEHTVCSADILVSMACMRSVSRFWPGGVPRRSCCYHFLLPVTYLIILTGAQFVQGTNGREMTRAFFLSMISPPVHCPIPIM